MTEPRHRRRYEMRRRREAIDRTRDRIARAAFELHGEIGPANATISAVADRAGVQRHTVYRHFPTLASLIAACTEHGMRTTGLPDPEPWQRIADPVARLTTALRGMYAYYAANAQLIENVLRDMPVMEELYEGSAAYRAHLGRAWEIVLAPWTGLRGRRGRQARAMAGMALEFGTWQSLVQRQGLSTEEAVDAMVDAVRSARS